MKDKITQIVHFIAPERSTLLHHPLYSQIKSIDELRKFTQVHVFAVWDFMSLLKSLQELLTCTTSPWTPSPHPNTRYLINEIVLAEESDEYIDGRRLSHYEMYLDAMGHISAETSQIRTFVQALHSGVSIWKAIDNLAVDNRIKNFLYFTFDVIERGQPHEIASAFTFGREDLIPDMFTSILKKIEPHFPDINMRPLIYYFERHIELDGDEHGPLALQMIKELGGHDNKKWIEMQMIAKQSLQKRIQLWDAISDSL